MLCRRLASRRHEYMNPSLLASQIATLEEPEKENAVYLDAGLAPQELVAEIITVMSTQ